jgi:hypothetical protein
MNQVSGLEQTSRNHHFQRNSYIQRSGKWEYVVAPQTNSPAEIGQSVFVHRADGPAAVELNNHFGLVSLQAGLPFTMPRGGSAEEAILLDPSPKAAGAGAGAGAPQLQLETQLQQLADRMSEDIHPMLFGASSILADIVQRLQRSNYLSKSDLHLLKGEANRLEILANWSNTDQLHSFRGLRYLPQVRTRFHASQLRQLLSESFYELCMAYSVKCHWEGWDDSLPHLYVDPLHLRHALVNLFASLGASRQRGTSMIFRSDAPSREGGNFSIQLVAPDHQLSWETVRLINGSQDWLPAKISDKGFFKAKQLIKAIGGQIFASNQSNDELYLRISIPTDVPSCFLDSWRHVVQANCRTSGSNLIRLFAVRCEPEAAAAMNQLIHSSAKPDDFVLRVTSNRWLIIEWHTGKSPRVNSVIGDRSGEGINPSGSIQPRLLSMHNDSATNIHRGRSKRLALCVYQSGEFYLQQNNNQPLSSLPWSRVISELSSKIQQLIGNHQLMVESLKTDSHQAAEWLSTEELLSSWRQIELGAAAETFNTDSSDWEESSRSDGPSEEFLAGVIRRWKHFQAESFGKAG